MGQIKVEIDWQKIGDFSGTGADVTGRVLRSSSVDVSYGRDLSSAFAPSVAGRGSLTLNNRSKDYTSRNTSSPLYGYIKPARPIRITRTYPASGSDAYSDTYSDTYTDAAATYTLFQGHTDDQPLNPDPNNKNVQLSLVDWLADFRGQTISTPLYQGLRSGDAINYILDHCNWTGDRDIDSGASIFPWWWEDGTDALDALEKVVRSEGPPAIITIGTSGEFIFRDRHHRLTRTASTVVQDVWTQATLARQFSVDEAWRNIINTGQITVDLRTMRTPEHVWESEGLITLAAGESRQFIASASDPFVNAEAPKVERDYTVIQGTVTTAISRTSGASTTITVTGVTAAYIQDLKLQAQPVQVAQTSQATASDLTSINDYGPRSFPNDLPWASIYDAEAILNSAIDMHAQPLPIVQAQFVCGLPRERGEFVLRRDLSDRVHITETESLLNQDFYLEAIAHSFTMGDFDHTVTVDLEAVPASEPDTDRILILGSTTPGHRLGEGVLVP